MTAAVMCLRSDHLSAVTTLLTDAFTGDVGMRAICCATSDGHYRSCLAAWFDATLRLQLITQQPAWVVIVDDVLVAVALLTHQHARFSLYGWLVWLWAVGRRCGWRAVWRTAHHERQRAVYRPAHLHGILEFLAVRRDQRGHGYATLLLDTVHQWSKTQALSTGIWLETTQLQNVSVFEHFGYKVMGRMRFEHGDALFLFRAND